jgi:hypothetical protein
MPFRPPLRMYHAATTGWIVVNLILKNTMYIIMCLFTYTCSQNTTVCQMVSLCNMQHYVIYNYMFLRTTCWWPTYKAEKCSCILRSAAYYIVIPSDKLLCFWLHVYVNIHIIIYMLSLCHLDGARGCAAGWGTALQAVKSRVRFSMMPLEFFIDIFLPAKLWHWSRLSS